MYGGVKILPTLNVKQDGGALQGERVTIARAAGGSGTLPPRGPGGKSSASGDFFGGDGGSGGGGSGGGKVPGGSGGSGDGSGEYNRKSITRNCQDHHIIPQQLKDHPLLKAASFNIHSRANLVFLPIPHADNTSRSGAGSMSSAQRAELPWQERRSFHSGRHDGEVIRQIQRKMNERIAIGEANNWSQSQYDNALREIISEYRRDLKQGNIALNSHHREWAERLQPTGGK